MSRSPSFAAVILAAGESSRMGTDKGVAALAAARPGAAAIRRHLPSVSPSRSRSQPILRRLWRARTKPRSTLIVHAEWRLRRGQSRPQSRPVQLAASGIYMKCSTVARRGFDHAGGLLRPVREATVEALRDAFASAPPNVRAVVPEYGGQHQPSLCRGRELIEVFLQAPPTAMAREVEHRISNISSMSL